MRRKLTIIFNEKKKEMLMKFSQEKEGDNNMFNLTYFYMEEIKQHYLMSKRHVQLSFTLAIIFCIIGYLLFTFFILNNCIGNTEPILLEILGGTISELFIGTALLLYKNSLKQLNQQYEIWRKNERFTYMILLVEQLPKDMQGETLKEIIKSFI